MGSDYVWNRKYVMRMRNRKFRKTPSGTFSPEVTSVTGSDRVRMRNRYILYYYQSSSTSTQLPKEWKGVRNIPLVGPSHRKLATGSDLIFPAHFSQWQYKMLVGVFSTTSASTPFPFIFIITYKVCCFRICCVVLQGWYF